ncbi:hypothetical protein SLS62_010017 [Diatrype stigma]|uniref:O-methyltransferase C-terminal domain-containing protein n=1 Tax=Diatrype stigma TaxID=117547 RepID=A0AAN9YJ18_9PEZI
MLRGAKGSQCIAFKQRYPDLPGRIILQDVPQVVEETRRNPLPGFEGIETECNDFFTSQPIKGIIPTQIKYAGLGHLLTNPDIGARVYYLRNILHDWPNHKCIKILENIKAAMAEYSVVLIDEMALPERNVPWRAAQQDLEMMACLAATERSECEWESLVNRVGLEVQSIRKYTEDFDSIIIVTLRHSIHVDRKSY